MKVLGIKIIGHDTGAALLTSETVIAISQERLNRKKYSSEFPKEAIDYCLAAGGLSSLEQVDIIAVEQMTESQEPLIQVLREQNLWDKVSSKIMFVNHHDAHAASAFFCSPFSEAAVLVADNAGQTEKLPSGGLGAETESFYHGTASGLKLLTRNYAPVNPYTKNLLGVSGLGNFYSHVTYYLSFGKHEEGKTMGLAPFGSGKLIGEIPEHEFMKKLSQWRYIFPSPLEPHPERDLLYLFKKSAYSRLAGWYNRLKSWRMGFRTMPAAHRFFPKHPAIFFTVPRRPKQKKLPDDFYTEFACWAQHYLEKVMVDYAQYLSGATRSKNLCIAGGVGLNSVANKKILDGTPFERVFIQPAAGDSGLPLGAALWAKHQILKAPVSWRMESAYLGKAYGDAEILQALSGKKFQKLENSPATAARLLSENKIVGWFQGRSEFGPRALGNRSILCSPIPANMKDKLNSQVKHRESFRPFAPACLAEKAGEYFDLDSPSPFMLLIAKVKKSNIPAVTHVDGTARVQTVTREQNPRFYALIEEFEKLTGVPVVLNTSFNDNGEPIVETPADAVKAFYNTSLDILIMNDFLLEKE